MQESTGAEKKKDEQGVGSESDATSKETLSDVEESEKTGSVGTKGDQTPAPDSAFDESDETKRADPAQF